MAVLSGGSLLLVLPPRGLGRCPRRGIQCRYGGSGNVGQGIDRADRQERQEHNKDLFSNGRCWWSIVSSAATAAPVLFLPEAALAVDGQFGILEGRSFALLHPIVMGGLFAYTIWAGYLGWQWRQVRTIQAEVTELKKQVKPREENSPPSEIERKIEKLTEVRKELVKGGFRDRHFNAGSILLGFGVTEAVGGCVNTWFRTGKLFPGPHLFSGAAITVLWALAASLVPAMQKGNDTARNLHIALNVANLLLFVSQIPTGLEIVAKVFEFTTWP
ncbi:uncharacterized protein LOC9657743 [Selaginella moellendorffii]|nr:uncharacterized protein LOC9657743 [Selaginella moellendorffii]|eukprot:XP_002974337.2 uncharacterized protein LOC9657743 [Selaginella moellendorffii]